MPEVINPQTKSARSNKRLIILGAILVCVFLVWVVTMIAGGSVGRGL